MWLINWIELIPEIYLAIIITFLLGYGVFLVSPSPSSISAQPGFARSDQQSRAAVSEGPNFPLNIDWRNKSVTSAGKHSLFLHFNYLCLFVLFWTFILLSPHRVAGASWHANYAGIGDVLFVDSFSVYIKFIVLFSTFVVLFVSLNLYPKYKIFNYEFTLLILLSLLGIFLIISARDLIIMYLAIETLSLSLYVLAAVVRSSTYSSEAGLKYFVLGALGSGLLLFGCALIYYSTGLTNFDALSNFVTLDPAFSNQFSANTDSHAIYQSRSFLIGAVFLIISLLFKLAAAPFHMWAPDVYEGSPTVVTFFFAVVPKISILYLLYKLLFGPFVCIFFPSDSGFQGLQLLLVISGVLSIFVGTFAAIYQNRIVRLMAFSAIAHIGFILLGFATGSFASFYSSFIYIILYIFMSINTFTFILSVYSSHQYKYFADLLAFAKYHPVLAITFSLTLFSIAGIPPLAGFFSKYYILLSLIDNHFYIVSSIIVVLSVISAYYYIRIIQWMYFSSSRPIHLLNTISSSSAIPTPQAIILGSTLYFIVTFLIYPKPILLITFDFFIQSLI